MNEQTKEAPPGFRIVEITREPVELFKILKFEGLASSGGDAKAAIASSNVLLNGEVETQKRKKIVSGDLIEFGDERICIKLSGSVSKNIDPPQVIATQESKTRLKKRRDIPALSNK